MGENMCDTGLGLAIGSSSFSTDKGCRREPKPPVRLHLWFPPCAMEEAEGEVVIKTSSMEAEDLENPISATTKKNRKLDDIDAENYDARKKLRLTKEQSTLLEDSFRAHNTLNPLQKQELAQKLGLRPRQVEVWFQNRRARTKLKQTEVDCEMLKRWCETLSDENRRLRRELQEQRFYAEVSKVEAMRPVCSSCDQRLMAAHEEEKGGVFAVGKKKAGVLQLCS